MSKSQIKGYVVKHCVRSDVEQFIVDNHYSGSINGCISDYCFSLIDGKKMIGAMFFGRMAMAGQWKKYGENESEVIELRRMCCEQSAPKNSESYFIGKALRWLKINTKVKTVVSYADAEYGHSGIIYKASNFEYLGMSKGAKIILYEGKRYHDKSLRTKYKGVLKPFAVKLCQAVNNGLAQFHETKGKHTYIYRLRK